MKPFSIVCRSCARKLKVTKATAVGQMLSCPNCGTMIKVTPPKGWEPPPPPNESISDLAEKQLGAEVPFGEFDDIDAILANPSQLTPAKKQARKKPAVARPSAPPQPTSSPSTARGQKPRRQRPESGKPQSPSANGPGQPKKNRPRKRPAAAVPHPDLQETLPNGIPEDLVSELPAQLPVRPLARRKRKGVRTESAPGESNEVSAAASGPVLPSDDWSSDATRRKRQLLFGLIGVFGGLLLACGIVTVVVLNMNKKPDQIVENPVPVIPEQPEVIDDGPLGQVDDANAEQPRNDELLDNIVENAVEEKPKAPPEEPKENKEPVEEIKAGVGRDEKNNISAKILEPERDDARPEVDRPRREKFPDEQEKRAPGVSPFENTDMESTNDIDIEPNTAETENEDVATFGERMGDLGALLQQSGTNMLEIRDVTSAVREQGSIGLPKYIVEKPDEIKPDFDKLALTINGMKYDKESLSRVLRVFASVSGVPITLDARTIAHHQKQPNPTVDKLVSDMTLDDSLSEILGPFGFQKTRLADGIKIGIPFSAKNVVQLHDLSGIRAIEQDVNADRLVSHIKTLIQPNIWIQDFEPASLLVQGKELRSECNQYAQLQISDLLTKLKATTVLLDDASNPDALEQVKTKWSLIKPKLDQPPGLVHALQKDIADFLNLIHKNTGLTVVVDWEHVMATEWNPNTIIPGNLSEPSIGEVILELCQAMELSAVVADESTLVLTTKEHSFQMLDLEVYPVAKLIESGFDPAKLLELIDGALGRQMMLRVYEPQCQCLIVVGSQTVQRQLEAIIDRVKK